jgi:hypothetical protein
MSFRQDFISNCEEMKSDQFADEIADHVRVFSNKKFPFHVAIKMEGDDIVRLVFTRCHFLRGLTINGQNHNVKGGIAIVASKIEGETILHDLNFGSTDVWMQIVLPDERPRNYPLWIKDCSLELLEGINWTVHSDIRIDGCNLARVEFQKVKVGGAKANFSVSISRTTVNHDLVARHFYRCDLALEKSTTVADSTTVETFEDCRFVVKNCDLLGKVEAFDGTHIRVEIYDSRLGGWLHIRDQRHVHGIVLVNTSVVGFAAINLASQSVDGMFVNSCAFGGGLKIIGNGPDSKIALLSTIFSSNSSGQIQIEKCRLNKFLITGVNDNAVLTCKDVSVRELGFTGFINRGSITFASLNIETIDPGKSTKLSFSEALVGKVVFQACDLSAFESVLVEKSDLSQLTLVGSSWFNFDRLDSGLPEGKERYRSLRGTFQQLKSAATANGDHVQAVEFRSSEMTNLRQELAQRDGSLGDNLMMFLNWSNNYGSSWLKPLGLIIAITALFYIMLMIAFEHPLNSGFFAQLFNPVRPLDFMLPNGGEVTNGMRWLDLIHRIILAYLIYQTVTGYRKYSKK